MKKKRKRQRGGQPLDLLSRSRIQSEAAVQQLCEAMEATPSASFDENFRPLVHKVLDKLIEAAEGDSPKKNEAAVTLADVSRFLSAQREKWATDIEPFRKRIIELSGTRLPDAPIAWLTVDYLDEAILHRAAAPFYCRPLRGHSESPADLLGKSWLRSLVDLPELTSENWKEWAKIVYARMVEEENSERVQAVLSKLKTRDSRNRKSGKVRLYDKQKEIFKAVQAAASKPVGLIRGLTKPSAS